MNDPLIRIIATVRRRWRARLLLRGMAILVSAGLAIFLVSAFGMDRLRFAPGAILAFGIVAWTSLPALAWWFLIRPLRRRVSDQQVALYLEEHEPALDGQVMGAVEFSGEAGRDGLSRALLERVVERAVARCHAIDDGRRVEHGGLLRSGGLLAGATLAAATVFLLNPGFLRNSRPFLLSPWAAGTPENPYAITVSPGDTLVARGADLRIDAMLVNFAAAEVELVMRALGSESWERWTMTPDDETGGFALLLFDLSDSTEYFVESGGVRSAVHTLAVTDLPYVDRIALEYHFPPYTGLGPQRQEETGDIAVLIGTQVTVEVVPTMPVPAGALAVGGDTIPLEIGREGTPTGEFTIRGDGTYRVLLAAPDGSMVAASPEYVIEALADQPPMIAIARPGRDVRVTTVDEVFLEVEAEDDFGLREVELVVSVNGASEDTVGLYGGRGGRKSVNAGHTLYLEELDLEPGDVLAYYARATDARRSADASVTDIFFVTIRPFDRTFRQAEQAGGAQGAGGMSAGELSERQRQIVAGTFNLLRDSARYTEQEFRDNVTTLTLAQGRLREDVEMLVSRIRSRGIVELDSTFAAVAEALPQAAGAMEEAEQRLGRRETREALPPEQRALQHVQRAEAAFRDRELSQAQGGGGGGNGSNAEELADLFELELDKMRNQYEEVERGRRRDTEQQIDETLERLRELARRQQQENERARAQAQRGTPSGATGAGQRRLAEQADELARQLERLSRERSRPDLAEAARRLQEAADAMRRASAQGQAGSAQGNRALDRLQDARRHLERNRSAGLRRDAEEALRRAERLADQQRGVMEDADRLSPDPARRREQLRRLVERKEQMADEVQGLEAELDRLRREARDDEPDAAGRLGEMARHLRDTRLRDKLLYSRGVVQQRDSAFIRNFEESIESDIDHLRRGIEEAVGQIGEQPEDRLERALDETHDLAQALESLGERAREAGEQAEAGGGRRGLNPEVQRQLQREFQQRRQDLQRLRGQLREGGVNVGPLDDMIRALGRFDNDGAVGDPRALDRLDEDIVQGLREFEYALRRQLVGENDERLFLSGSEEVPSEYREMVEEYYRRLAEQRR